MLSIQRIAALAAWISLSAYAGTPAENAAVAEAMAQLDSAKIMVEQTYRANRIFPNSANSPLPMQLSSARYVASISYTSVGDPAASVIISLTGTGNQLIDGKYIGMFAAGRPDGDILWTCGTAGAPTSGEPNAITAMYPYLPPECRH